MRLKIAITGPAFLFAAIAPAAAQTLTYIDGSSRKLPGAFGQLIGGQWNPERAYDPLTGVCLPIGPTFTDQDWDTGVHLLNHTWADAQVGGADRGATFVGQFMIPTGLVLPAIYFLNGDTLYWNADNAVATSLSSDPEVDGFSLDFLHESADPAGPTFLVGNHVSFSMAGDDNPQAGVSIGGDNYVVCSTGHDPNATPPDANAYTILTHFDTTNLYGPWDVASHRISSAADGGHFLHVSLVHHGDHVFMFGTGAPFRHNDVYLAKIRSRKDEPYPHNNLWTGKEPTRYFESFDGTNPPTWKTDESLAQPVVFDANPSWTTGDCATPPCPTIGDVSVQFNKKLGLWLMTFDGGRQIDPATGLHDASVYFCYAKEPWGTWSPPVVIFNAARDGAYGTYIHNENPALGPTGGPEGPMIGSATPCFTQGGIYAPLMIEPFTKVDLQHHKLTIYYTMSTWNPYTIVLMRSELTISP
jgi:hypothetical protein